MERNNVPSWYWNKGLHDATILNIAVVNIQYDFTQKNPIRNYYSIKLDSSNALFDTSIEELRFMNAKILSNKDDYQGCWWFDDSVEICGAKIIITIQVTDYRNPKQHKTLKIQCEDVTVLRK